jgi:F-type H+-transporting ATPase subunit delta
MKRSKEARRTARELLRTTIANGKLDEGRAREIVEKIKATKPRGYLQILETYLKLLRLELEKRHAVVESAVALDGATEHKIREDLTRSYGGDLTFEFRVDPALLGGMRVQVGSDVWDGSVQARLAQLADAIG